MSVPYVVSILCGSLYTLPLNLLWSHSKKLIKISWKPMRPGGLLCFIWKIASLTSFPVNSSNKTLFCSSDTHGISDISVFSKKCFFSLPCQRVSCNSWWCTFLSCHLPLSHPPAPTWGFESSFFSHLLPTGNTWYYYPLPAILWFFALQNHLISSSELIFP